MRLTIALAAFAAGVAFSLILVDPLETKHFTALGVVVAIVTFVWNAKRSRDQQREQHTITILFQTRLSSEFRENLAKRKWFFAEGERVAHATYRAFMRAARDRDLSDADALRRRESAEAIRSLLNYYEFIALGVARGDLDEAMLRGSIRGIMCALVIDMAGIIKGEQAENPLAYRNLTWLFRRWRVHEEDPGFAEPATVRLEALRFRLALRIMPPPARPPSPQR